MLSNQMNMKTLREIYESSSIRHQSFRLSEMHIDKTHGRQTFYGGEPYTVKY